MTFTIPNSVQSALGSDGQLHCLRCGWAWPPSPRTLNSGLLPKCCASCRSTAWDKPPRRPLTEEDISNATRDRDRRNRHRDHARDSFRRRRFKQLAHELGLAAATALLKSLANAPSTTATPEPEPEPEPRPVPLKAISRPDPAAAAAALAPDPSAGFPPPPAPLRLAIAADPEPHDGD